MEIKLFNINQALNGASIGFASGNIVVQYIIDFKRSNEKTASKEFVGIGQDDNKEYYFDNKGECYDKLATHRLWKIEEEINTDERGTVASRGDAEGGIEKISIDNIQPREQFALAAMQIILNKLDTPILGIDNFKITRVCDLSFKIAQQMMSTAAKYRASTKSEPEESIDIDKNSITNVSDKILYNIQEYMKVMKDNSTSIKDNGIKLQDNPEVKVINTISSYVTNQSLDVNVVNTPTVKVEQE